MSSSPTRSHGEAVAPGKPREDGLVDAALVDVTMPQMGVSVAEGTVVEWKKAVGDAVARDEVVCAISTDKIDTDVESPAAGRLAEILVDVGTTVEVGTVLARLDVGGGDAPGAADASTGEDGRTGEAAAALAAPGAAGELQGDTAETHDDSAQEPEVPSRANGHVRYSPVVLRIAAEHGIDLAAVPGTGRGGRVRKQDVLAAVARAQEAPAEEPPMHIESPYRPEPAAPPPPRPPRFARPEPTPTASESSAAPEIASADGRTSAPLTRMRASIGRHMRRSLETAATCTTVVEVDLTRVEALRRERGLTGLAYVARATVDTLREFPGLNATLEDDILTTWDAVHLGIAVSLGDEGLVVPVVRDAQELSVEGLARRIRELADAARAGRLSPDDVRGATFTITNPGAAGSILATPIINQPQVAILDTEAVVKRPVVVTDEFGGDAIAIRSMAYFCMSWDHRALDGVLAARFLAALRTRLEAWPTT